MKLNVLKSQLYIKDLRWTWRSYLKIMKDKLNKTPYLKIMKSLKICFTQLRKRLMNSMKRRKLNKKTTNSLSQIHRKRIIYKISLLIQMIFRTWFKINWIKSNHWMRQTIYQNQCKMRFIQLFNNKTKYLKCLNYMSKSNPILKLYSRICQRTSINSWYHMHCL
jgi:hypothetical protein